MSCIEVFSSDPHWKLIAEKQPAAGQRIPLEGAMIETGKLRNRKNSFKRL